MEVGVAVGAVPIANGAAALEVVPVPLHMVAQMQMVQIQPDGEADPLPADGKVQIRKLILVGLGR